MFYGVDSAWPQNGVRLPPNISFNITCAARANVPLTIDDGYAARVDASRQAGVEVGHYFFNGSHATPTECAEFMWNNLHDFRIGADIIAIDCEDEASTNTVAWTPAHVLEFVQQLGTHNIPASAILIYMNQAINYRYNWQEVADAGCPLWYARPGTTANDQRYWTAPTARQTGSNAFDLDQSTKTLASFWPTPTQPINYGKRQRMYTWIRNETTGNIILINGDNGSYRSLTLGEWEGYASNGAKYANLDAATFDNTTAALTPYKA